MEENRASSGGVRIDRSLGMVVWGCPTFGSPYCIVHVNATFSPMGMYSVNESEGEKLIRSLSAF